jgi:hypothetical protein
LTRLLNPRASYLADPTIQSLTSLLREIADGLLAFPRFQRPFVWIPSQRLELARTILRGLPIGTFMTWRTSENIGVFRTVGLWALPTPAEAAAGRQYVLDGLQRLSTLYVALTPGKKLASFTEPRAAREAQEEAPREIYVDLSTPELDVFDDNNEEDDEIKERVKRSILLTDVLDSRRLLKRQRAFADLPDEDDLVERADRVAEAVRNYKVPIVPFVSDDLEQVTRAFQLVNSQGTQMSQVHMVNALAWREDFSLLDTIESLRRGSLAELGWDQLDESVLLRCFALAVGLDSYGFSVVELAKRLRQHSNASEQVAKSLRTVATVLRQVCHIRSPALVPYTTQIVVLCGALSNLGSTTQAQRELVRNWVWYTSYAEAFGGATSASMVGGVTESLREALAGKPFVWKYRKAQRRRFPQQVDFRHGRARVFALRLAALRARVDGKRVYRLLAEEGAAALPNVLPAAAGKGSWRFGRGGRVLMPRDELAALRAALVGPYRAELGSRHLISEPAWTAYREERFEDFVSLRDKDLERQEAKHFSAVHTRLFAR